MEPEERNETTLSVTRRDVLKLSLAVGVTLAASGATSAVLAANSEKPLVKRPEDAKDQFPKSIKGQHFSTKGRMPSKYTIELQNGQRKTLPFEDKRDFEEAQRGLIARPYFKQIPKDGGGISWDLGKFDFLLKGKDFDSIHPSLQRQAILNMTYGLYEVIPGIYQVRGFDLANVSFIKGQTGWIVIDPLTVKETSGAALKFINEKLGERPVVAVIFSHAHGDHFGGVRGVVNEVDLKAGKVKIIAPRNFMYEAISENLFAANAMVRRKAYTYGDVLPVNPFGNVDMAIGKAVAAGDVGLIPPTNVIEKDIGEMTIDGVKMIFQNTPNTEAPAEMNTWFPDLKVLWMAENVVASLHNVLTLRGAKVRDTSKWAKYINEALYMWGDEAEVMFQSHNWPRWEKGRIEKVLRGQRDMYANLNNQVLHLANEGVTINQIHNVYEPPKSLQKDWFARGYHGTYRHNSRAVIQNYLGYWDGNPATVLPLSPGASAPLYVEMMGGAQKIMEKGKELYNQGKYMLAQEILNKLIYAQPKNEAAKDLLADVWEQIGYQAEGAGIRNIYLSGAKELRDGIVPVSAAKSGSPDFVRGTSTELFLDYLGIQVDSRKAEGMKFKINLVTPDNGEKFVVEMSNATLTTLAGYQAKEADLTITINRSDLEDLMIGKAKLIDKVQAGAAKMAGNTKILEQLKTTLTQFDPWFEMLPGTKKKAEKEAVKQEVFLDEAPVGPAAITDD
jgi:alkyl sulfatase BDS1-like metallo-beta-lactamase superfamily hydrolase